MSALLIVSSLIAGLGVGFVSALLGIGGSPVMIPYMIFVLGLGQHVAEGTSLLVIIPTALVGVLAHHRRGLVSVRAAAVVGLGGTAGAFGGATVAQLMDAGTLQTIFGAVLTALGVQTMLSARRITEG